MNTVKNEHTNLTLSLTIFSIPYKSPFVRPPVYSAQQGNGVCVCAHTAGNPAHTHTLIHARAAHIYLRNTNTSAGESL